MVSLSSSTVPGATSNVSAITSAASTLSRSPFDRKPGAGPGAERAHLAVEIARRIAPVEPLVVARQLGRVGDAGGRLGLRRQRPGCETRRAPSTIRRAPSGCQLVVQHAGVVFWPDRDALLQQHRAGIETLVHLHDGDAGLGVAGQDGALDRRRAAPARQQRGMDVEAAEPRRGQDRRRQDQAVGDDHGRIETESGEVRLLCRDLSATPECAPAMPRSSGNGVDRRRPRSLAAAGRARRLGVDGSDLVAGIDERAQRRDGEVRRAHEGEAQAGHRRSSEARVGHISHHPSRRLKGSRCEAAMERQSACSRSRSKTPVRFAFRSLRRIMLRLSAEMWSTNSTPSR